MSAAERKEATERRWRAEVQEKRDELAAVRAGLVVSEAELARAQEAAWDADLEDAKLNGDVAKWNTAVNRLRGTIRANEEWLTRYATSEELSRRLKTSEKLAEVFSR